MVSPQGSQTPALLREKEPPLCETWRPGAGLQLHLLHELVALDLSQDWSKLLSYFDDDDGDDDDDYHCYFDCFDYHYYDYYYCFEYYYEYYCYLLNFIMTRHNKSS